ncbi:3-phosphoserine/phosphohydroxythreonine transaminase [Myxococcota bacterium]|nr:3-phosphoserine/phosphohydroxythreonine transaminase [Myxococcota bacterium]MBU1534892.1 3-phosphoserine/phosphohydroxythreonine transaminase [Myxococcota bacterium]
MARKHNFYAGPAVLPVSVIKKAQESLFEYGDSGIGVAEMSHRSKQFDGIVDGALASIKRLYNVSDDYGIVFVQGGASMVMAINALNFVTEGGKAQFVDTGTWARRAISEVARSKAEAEVIWSGKDVAYGELPELSDLTFDPKADFVHMTSNNTIAGTQFRDFPKTEAPLFVDMSSDFFSHPINMNQFGMIYGGIQKNLGPAGSALVIVRKDLLDRIPAGLSEMLDMSVYVKKGSMYNTPAAFTIYMTSLVLDWLENDIGGLENMDKINKEKAGILYDCFDQSGGFYRPTVKNPAHRSLMNVTFRLADEALESTLITDATAAGFIGLKGHRSVGGLRASIYNSCPTESVREFVKYLNDFAAKNG